MCLPNTRGDYYAGTDSVFNSLSHRIIQSTTSAPSHSIFTRNLGQHYITYRSPFHPRLPEDTPWEMVDSHDDTDSAPEPIEDGQLTIRIPNPKVYMARQSMWIGRRGKPRCDHCRMKNLKVGCHELSLSYEPRNLTTI